MGWSSYRYYRIGLYILYYSHATSGPFQARECRLVHFRKHTKEHHPSFLTKQHALFLQNQRAFSSAESESFVEDQDRDEAKPLTQPKRGS
jgi:hypothetical protein